VPPIDHTSTSPIPRHAGDTGEFPAARTARRRRPLAWRVTAAVALVLLWAAMTELAYVLARAALLLWAWR
jgi:hypothetical protein